MTFHVWRDRFGKYRAICYRCGFTGTYRWEWDAEAAEEGHLCTEVSDDVV